VRSKLTGCLRTWFNALTGETDVMISKYVFFYGGIGRSDFYGGDLVALLTEIKHKILTMPEDTVLYPGHGRATTVRHEKNTNPYFHMSNK